MIVGIGAFYVLRAETVSNTQFYPYACVASHTREMGASDSFHSGSLQD